ncbi:unnamed protein product [Linum tenue]|uniref:Uncharacterized protein n=1 Tax=Linum tenue TaxID=586396 RepID=A0AAV0RBY0_9ROSI|nr:unnamed protein product [Linum tenue]
MLSPSRKPPPLNSGNSSKSRRNPRPQLPEQFEIHDHVLLLLQWSNFSFCCSQFLTGIVTFLAAAL